MSLKKVLLNYDYKLAPMTTAYYYEKSLRRSKSYLPYRVGQIDPSDCDYIINFETCDGVITSPGVLSAYYEIDNHLIAGAEVWHYKPVDFVFIAQQVNFELYPLGKTHVISLAADPMVHRPIEGVKEIYDIGFIGNDTYPRRKSLLNLLEKDYKVLRTTSDAGLEYSKVLSQCKILFNCSLAHDVNMRFFEAMAIGKPLVTDYLVEQDQFAVNNLHYHGYFNENGLIRAVQILTKSKKKREIMAKGARENIILNHTYGHRVAEMIRIMGGDEIKLGKITEKDQR